MIKYVAVVCLMVALLSAAPQAAPQQNPQEVQILRFDSEVQPDGYNFAYETSDGTSRQEEGKIEGDPASEDAGINVKGQYSYVAPDGKTYTVTFTAGPNGFQPKVSLGA